MKAAVWESLEVLAGFSRESINFDQEFVSSLQSAFWIELATEYDAENFCQYLKDLETTGQLHRSELFQAFECVWRRDELNHTRGFARIFSTLYSVPEEELFRRLRERNPNFTSIAQFLVDEFTVSVVLAYDEIATTKAYQYDLVHRYPVFGNQALLNWMKLVARDEARHFENALNIIKTNYKERIPELPSLLDKLISLDAIGGEYGATFVLDHSANHYDLKLLNSCRRLFLRRCGLAD